MITHYLVATFNDSNKSFQEEEPGENEVKKVKSREWEKEKSSEPKDDQTKSDAKDGTVFESKTYREQRKLNANAIADKKKKDDKKETITKDDDQSDDKKRDKFKESPREQKSKKYSDTRKERIKQTEFTKSDKQSVISKIISAEGKTKSLNHDDIKPFTQLPQVKTDDLSKIIEGMDKKAKIESELYAELKKEFKDFIDETSDKKKEIKERRSSLESGGELSVKEEGILIRQKSLDERANSIDREGSEEKEKSDSSDRRTERRIRNKVIYICQFHGTIFIQLLFENN